MQARLMETAFKRLMLSWLQTALTCVWSSSDSKVPAWGNIDWLGIHIALSLTVASLCFWTTVPIRWRGIKLLQVNIVIYQDHFTHPCVITGHVGLPNMSKYNCWVVQESHSVHSSTTSLYYLLSILFHGHTYLEIECTQHFREKNTTNTSHQNPDSRILDAQNLTQFCAVNYFNSFPVYLSHTACWDPLQERWFWRTAWNLNPKTTEQTPPDRSHCSTTSGYYKAK